MVSNKDELSADRLDPRAVSCVVLGAPRDRFSPAEIEKITAHFDAARDQLEPALMHDDGSGGRSFGTSRSTNMIAVSACFALVSPRSRHFRMLRRLSSRFRIGRLYAVPDYTNTQAP